MFTAADHLLWARQVCEVMGLTVAPHNINNVRLKLKRLTGRGIGRTGFSETVWAENPAGKRRNARSGVV